MITHHMRMSGMPLTAKCPGSYKLNKDLPQTQSPPSRMGNAKHDLAEQIFKKWHEIRLNAIALKWGVASKDLEEPLDRLSFLKDINKTRLGCANTEEEVTIEMAVSKTEEVILTGHIDLIYIEDQVEAFEYDWKTGRLEVDPIERNWQILSYVCGTFEKYPNLTKITFTIVYTEGYIKNEEITITREQYLSDYLPALVKHVRAALAPNPAYELGAHCQYCPGRNRCPLVNRQLPEIINQSRGVNFNQLSVTKQSEAITMSLILKAALKDFDVQAKQHVRDNGPIPMGHGKEYAMSTFDEEKADPIKAWNIIERKCGIRMAETVSISLPAAEKVITDIIDKMNKKTGFKPKKGYKLREKQQLRGELRDAGALITTTKERFAVKNIKRKSK